LEAEPEARAGLSAVFLAGLSAVILVRRLSCPPSFLSAVFVAEWRTGIRFFGEEVIVARKRFEPQIQTNVHF